MQIEVRFYSGHKRSSLPQALVIDGATVLVEAIISSEVREDFRTRRRSCRYVCLARGIRWEVVRQPDDTTTCRRLEEALSRP